MRKIGLLFIICLFLAACTSEVTFEDYVSELVETNNYIGVQEILTVIEFDDAEIGLSLIETEEDKVILFLSSEMYDEKSNVYTDLHGKHVPISYSEDGNRIIWMFLGSNDYVMEHESDKAKYHSYHFGILDGSIKEIRYNGNLVRSDTVSFHYLGKNVSATLWVLPLELDDEFDKSKLSY